MRTGQAHLGDAPGQLDHRDLVLGEVQAPGGRVELLERVLEGRDVPLLEGSRDLAPARGAALHASDFGAGRSSGHVSLLLSSSSRRRRLTGDLRKAFVDARPARSLGGPDGRCRPGDLRIVQSAGTDERVGVAALQLRWKAEYRTSGGKRQSVTTSRCRQRSHSGVRCAANRDGLRGKAHVHRAAAGAQILTETAPAHPRHDRLSRDLVAHRFAQAAAGLFSFVFSAEPLLPDDRRASTRTAG